MGNYLNTEIKNAIQAADSEAQYDESAKRLLAQKYVLAHILVRTVEEFHSPHAQLYFLHNL